MKSLILYGSPKKLTNAHKLVTTPAGKHLVNGALPQPAYYVRAKVFPGNVERAFDRAIASKGGMYSAMEGETLLNTMPIDE